ERAPANALARKLLAATELKLGNGAKAEEILIPLAPEKSNDPTVLALMGEIRLRAKDYTKAEQYLERAFSLAPNPALRTDLALTRLAQGDSERSMADLEAASAASPGFVKADSVLIAAFLGKKEYDQALEAIARLEKKLPNSPVTFNLKGVAYLGKNDETTARANFERALALQPGYFPAAANLAQLDLKGGNAQAAKRRFETVLVNDKSSLPAMLALANLAQRDRREAEYVSWLERAAKVAPSAAQPRLLLARYYIAKREPAKALTLAYAISAANPGSAEILDVLGSAQLAAGERDNALATYRKLVAAAPSSPLAYYRLANAQLAAKQADEARRSLKRALELKPDFIDAQESLTALEIATGRFAEAIALAQHTQQRFPRLPAGFALEGDAWMAQKQYPKAASLYEAARQRGPSGLLAIKLDRAYTLAGKPGEGEMPLLQWLKDHPEDAPTRLYYAGSLAGRGQRKPAIEQYQLLLRRNPGDVVALNNLASAMQEEHDPRALGYAEQAYKLQPGNPGVLDTLGWILVGQGQASRGIDLLRQALSKAPDSAVLQYHLAAALAQSGDKERAKAELQRLLDSGVSFPQEQEARSLLRQLQGAVR
ncbi:MAG TPA: XrtA/PEP-CTERM system TPR-repeat protein PrsT, partial [Thiobacillaceae bacterium]|nr:XrtA/PEP-CTERM system TPR-repeat protein PrsT [Thiobacillaceae bacterium]